MDDAKSIRPGAIAISHRIIVERFPTASAVNARYGSRCALLPALWLTLGLAGVMAPTASAPQTPNANLQPIETNADSAVANKSIPAASDASCPPTVTHPPHVGSTGNFSSAKPPTQLFVNCSLAEQSIISAVSADRKVSVEQGFAKSDRKDPTSGSGQARADNPLAWVAEIIFSVLAIGSFVVAALLLRALYYRLTRLDEHVGVETDWGGLGGGLGGWRTSTAAALALMVVLFAGLAALFSHQLLSVMTLPLEGRAEGHSPLMPKAPTTPKAE